MGVPPVGAEQAALFRQKTLKPDHGGAKGGATHRKNDADLTEVLAAWPQLTQSDRVLILSSIRRLLINSGARPLK